MKEVAQGLHKKKDVEAYYQQKGKLIPEDISYSDRKPSSSKRAAKKSKTNEDLPPRGDRGKQTDISFD